MTVHDFGDGRGRVPAHRHPNGGGWVAETAHVAPTVYVERDAQVYGHARVCDHVNLLGEARVYDHANLRDCVLVDGNARVYGKAYARDNVRISGKAHVSGGACLSGTVLVSGTARVSGDVCLDGDAWVRGGDWKTSPLYIQGSYCACGVSRPGYFYISCVELPFEEWLARADELAKQYRFSPAQVEEYLRYLALVYPPAARLKFSKDRFNETENRSSSETG